MDSDHTGITEQNVAMGENSIVVHLTCVDSSSITCPCPPLSLSAVSAADEREDQYKLLQVKNKRRLIHHTEKPLVQIYEPLD